MSEETTSTVVEQAQSTGLPPEAQQSFQDSIWGKMDTPTQTEQQKEQVTEQVKETASIPAATITTSDEQEEILEPEAWMKREFNVDNAETLRQQLKEYKELKEKPAISEYKFENEDSQRLAEAISKGDRKEVLRILQTQQQVENLASADVNDETAESIIKLGLKLKHNDLTDAEINHKFNKQYGIPKEPIKGEFDDDTEFEQKHEAWKERVAEIKMDKIIEAKTMKPELLKANSELKLPEINKDIKSATAEPTPEELEKFNQAKDSFLQSAKQTVEGFNGFNVQVKDKDVDFSVGYTPSIEEKTLITEKLNTLAESGFDANAIFAERWYDNATQTFKTDQMTKDLSRMLLGENADKKLAFDSANKRMEVFLKEKKNVSVTEGNKDSTFKPNGQGTSSEKLAADFWGKN